MIDVKFRKWMNDNVKHDLREAKTSFKWFDTEEDVKTALSGIEEVLKDYPEYSLSHKQHLSYRGYTIYPRVYKTVELEDIRAEIAPFVDDSEHVADRLYNAVLSEEPVVVLGDLIESEKTIREFGAISKNTRFKIKIEGDVLKNYLQPCPWKKLRSDNRYIYLIECEGKYKIGVAKDIGQRVKTLQAANPSKITAITSYRVETAKALDVEKSVHKILERLNIRGEWFDLDIFEDVVGMFESLCVLYDK